MRNNIKETSRFHLNRPVNGKRDYYFHADEDFREDRDWGKVKTLETAKSYPAHKKARLSV